MALKIRLSRAGSKKRPVYRVVVADSRFPRDGRFIEKVGLYNPLLKKDDPNRVQLDFDKIKSWIDKGAKPTDKLARWLGEANIIPMPAQKDNPKKALPKKKAQERLAAEKEAAEAPTRRYLLSPPIPASPIWFEVYHPSDGSNLLLVLSTLWFNDIIERMLSPSSDFTDADAPE